MTVVGVSVLKISLLWWIMFGKEGSVCPTGPPSWAADEPEKQCVCVRLCAFLAVCVYTLLSCEQRSPASPLALTKLSAHTQSNSLPLLFASDDALDLAEPT